MRPVADRRGLLQSIGFVLLAIPLLAMAAGTLVFFLVCSGDLDSRIVEASIYTPLAVTALVAALTVGPDPTRSVPARIGIWGLAILTTFGVMVLSWWLYHLVISPGSG